MGCVKPSLHEVVGQRIKRARLDQNISPSALARYLHRSQGVVKDIETGEGGVTLLMLYALAAALNCKPQDFLPSPEKVTLPKQGRAVNLNVERLLADALVSEDPEECRRWVINTIQAAVLVNLERKVERRLNNG